FLAAFAHQLPPAEYQARAEPVAASNIADRHAGLHRLGNHGQLQLGREATPTGDAGDHFDFRERIGHRHMPRLIPRPSGLSSVSGENGVHSTHLPFAGSAASRTALMSWSRVYGFRR